MSVATSVEPEVIPVAPFSPRKRLASVAAHVVTPSDDAELGAYKQRTCAMDLWMSADRFRYIKRPYTAADVARFQGSPAAPAPVYAAGLQSEKLYNLLRDCQAKKTMSHTFGALDPIQVAQMAEAGLTSVYLVYLLLCEVSHPRCGCGHARLSAFFRSVGLEGVPKYSSSQRVRKKMPQVRERLAVVLDGEYLERARARLGRLSNGYRA